MASRLTSVTQTGANNKRSCDTEPTLARYTWKRMRLWHCDIQQSWFDYIIFQLLRRLWLVKHCSVLSKLRTTEETTASTIGYTFNFCSLAFLSRKEILLLNPFCLCEGCFEVNYLGCIFFFSSWKCILSIKLAILLKPRWAGLWFVTGIGQLEWSPSRPKIRVQSQPTPINRHSHSIEKLGLMLKLPRRFVCSIR